MSYRDREESWVNYICLINENRSGSKALEFNGDYDGWETFVTSE